MPHESHLHWGRLLTDPACWENSRPIRHCVEVMHAVKYQNAVSQPSYTLMSLIRQKCAAGATSWAFGYFSACVISIQRRTPTQAWGCGEEKREDYTFRRCFNVKPGNIHGGLWT